MKLFYNDIRLSRRVVQWCFPSTSKELQTVVSSGFLRHVFCALRLLALAVASFGSSTAHAFYTCEDMRYRERIEQDEESARRAGAFVNYPRYHEWQEITASTHLRWFAEDPVTHRETGAFGYDYTLHTPAGDYLHGGNAGFLCVQSFPTQHSVMDKSCPGAPGGCVGDPINSATGNVYRNEVDIRSGKFLGFTRYYNSTGPIALDTLGPQWRHSYSRRIAASTDAYGRLVAAVQLENGNQYVFTYENGWVTDAEISDTITELKDGNGSRTGWKYFRGATRTTEFFNAAGRLDAILDGEGFTTTLTYSDASTPPAEAPFAGLLIKVADRQQRELAFSYDATGRLTHVTAPDGSGYSYSYDALGMLAMVEFPGGASKTYLYDEAPYVSTGTPAHSLTGVVDESQVRMTTYAYDDSGRAYSVSEPAGARTYSLVYNGDGSVDVVDPLNQTSHYTYTTIDEQRLWAGTDVHCMDCRWGAARLYDDIGHLMQVTDFNGTKTNYVYGLANVETQRVEASGTSSERRVDTRWNIEARLPLQRDVMSSDSATPFDSRMQWAYNTRGQVEAKCQVDPADVASLSYVCSATTAPPSSTAVRRWLYTYCEDADLSVPNSTCPIVGLLKAANGPRNAGDAGMVPGQDDITTYAYYPTTDESGCATPGGVCHRKGDLWKVTNALGQVTENVSYDKVGRVTRSRDANGTLTDIVYNGRGWPLTRTVRANASGLADPANDAVTHFAYDATGAVTRVTPPDGAYMDYTYDAAHRLTDIVDALGNRVHYTLDPAGNRTKEETFDSSYNPGMPGQGLTRSMSRVYNPLSRLVKTLNATDVALQDSTSFDSGMDDGYDGNGNLLRSKDARDVQTSRSYDALDRLVQTVQDYEGTSPETQDATITYAYDARNNVRSVQDPDGLTTGYVYNGFSDLVTLHSPDTGTTSYAYDPAGNRISATDARGVTTTYTYDALNRLVGIAFPDASLNISFSYDQTDNCSTDAFNIGRMTTRTDHSGSVSYCYDRRGNVMEKQQTISGPNGESGDFDVRYAYSVADRLSAITYPSGTSIQYLHDAAGRISAVHYTTPAIDREPPIEGTLVDSVTYYPFGPQYTIVFGNGRTLTKAYDQNYQIDSIASSDPEGLLLQFGTDAMGDIVSADGPPGAPLAGRLYTYDALYRLTNVRSGGGTNGETFTYNKTGDRTSKQIGKQKAMTYSYAAGSHRLDYDGLGFRSYDGNGNTLGTSVLSDMQYDDRNRLVSVTADGAATPTVFDYSGDGERVWKGTDDGSADPTMYVYDEAGHLLHESASTSYADAGGANEPRSEYVYLNGAPVAVVRFNRIKISRVPHPAYIFEPYFTYLETDHLGTPRVAVTSDDPNAAPVWKWDFLGGAFGDDAADEDPDGDGIPFAMSLRFPGQQYDQELRLHYNFFRDYEPDVARYMQSDPIGLGGGINSYQYVHGQPSALIDPFGLAYGYQDCGPDEKVLWTYPPNPFGGNAPPAMKSCIPKPPPPAEPCPKENCEFDCEQASNRSHRGWNYAGAFFSMVVGAAAVFAPEPTGVTKACGYSLVGVGFGLAVKNQVDEDGEMECKKRCRQCQK